MAYNVVQKCPLTFRDWSNRASSKCSRHTYHCVEDEYSRIVEVCAVPLWIEAGHCPVYNTDATKMDSRACSGKLCPKEVFRSDVVYKYNACQQFALGPSTTISTRINATTPLTDASKTSIMVGSVTSVLFVILLAISGFFLWRRRSFACSFGSAPMNSTEEAFEKDQLIKSEFNFDALEKITPKELNADMRFVSECQEYLEKSGKTLAMFGKLGSGKRTLAAQVAIRLAKDHPKLEIKIVTEIDTISEDLKSMHSTILVIHDPIKTWYTTRYTEEVINILFKICTSAKNKNNNIYVITIFHCQGWNILTQQFRKKNRTVEKLFPKREPICENKIKLTEMAKLKQEDISNVSYPKGETIIGESFKMTLFLKDPRQDILNDPIMFIIRELKALEESKEIQKRLAFKVMVIFTLYGGEIAKSELRADRIAQHSLFDDLREKMDVNKSIDECIELLLKTYLEENGQSYRILHDVVTRCTFIAAFKNQRSVLFKECDPITSFECLRLKSFSERWDRSGEIIYDYRNLKIGIPSETFQEIARSFIQREEMTRVLRNSRIYDDKKFQDEWNKAELYFTDVLHVTDETEH